MNLWVNNITSCYLLLSYRVAGEPASELFEYFAVYFAEHDSAVYLTAFQLRQLLQCMPAVFIVLRKHAEGNEHLVGMQTGIVASKVFYLCLLYRFNHALRDELYLVADASQVLCGVEEECCTASEQGA